MEKFTTITKILRDEIMKKYKNLRNDLSKEYCKDLNNIDYSIDETDKNELEALQEYYVPYVEEKTLKELVDYIKNNKYKNLLYLIIFNDVYEYIKVNQVCNNTAYDDDLEILDFLETFNIKELINKANTSNTFLTDIVKIFTYYHLVCTTEDLNKNKKIIELSNNTKHINKFKIHILDDIQRQYTKTRKIY